MEQDFKILSNEELDTMRLYAGIDNIRAYKWRREELRKVLDLYYKMNNQTSEDYTIYNELKMLFEAGRISELEYQGLTISLSQFKSAIIDILSATRRIMIFADWKIKQFSGYKPLVNIDDLNSTLNDTLEKEQKKVKN